MVSPAGDRPRRWALSCGMVLLTRTVRFSVNTPGTTAEADQGGDNTFAAYPSMRGAGRHYEMDIRCRGTIDPATGYFLNIKEIDRAVRGTVIPRISAGVNDAGAEPTAMLREVLPALNRELSGAVASVRWWLSPYYSIEMSPDPTDLPARRAPALLRQQFEFAAAHRLHIDSMSAEENFALFGKCNNPRGHGHNYRVEPCVEVEAPTRGVPVFSLASLERLTAEFIIDRYDHKHLNEDTVEFGAGPGGLNPSVENIAKVCFDLLVPPIARAGARLRSITVWETDKTSCTYPG